MPQERLPKRALLAKVKSLWDDHEHGRITLRISDGIAWRFSQAKWCKWCMGAKPWGHVPPNLFCQGDTIMLLSPNFFMKQSQSSVTKFSSFNFSTARLLQYFHQESLMLCPSNFCMTLNQSSVIKFSSFIFLPPEVSDYKPRMDGGDTSPNILARGTLMLSSLTFAWHKVNLLASSSVLLLFLPPEVKNNKAGMDGGINP